MSNNYVEINVLLGKTLKGIVGMSKESEEIIFECTDGSKYKMYHDQNCCETVQLEDIIGDVIDLVGSPITMAEDVSNESETDEFKRGLDSYTWTWYKLATIKGYVTLRWLGESNGYYGEEVDIMELEAAHE